MTNNDFSPIYRYEVDTQNRSVLVKCPIWKVY